MYGENHIARLEEMVRGGLAQWGLAPDTDVRLLTFSENATFLLTEPASGVRRVLRVHRPGYHGAAEIESELAWVEALRRDCVVRTPAPLRGGDGRLLQFLGQGDWQRQAVLFEFVAGREPGADESLVLLLSVALGVVVPSVLSLATESAVDTSAIELSLMIFALCDLSSARSLSVFAG